MNTEYRLHRLERTLGTLISWLPHELGPNNMRSLLDMLHAPEDPNCLEGAGRTSEEVAQNARELDAIAPTPADKFALMFGAGGSPETDAVLASCSQNSAEVGVADLGKMYQHAQNLERQRNAVRKERDEARSLVAAFEKAVNEGCSDGALTPGHRADRAVSEVDYIFRLHKELRERVEKVIGHWRDTDWFREGGLDMEIVVGVNEAKAIKLLKYLKP